MHILVSNDDGVAAPGIIALVSSLRSVGDVSVFAPERQQSCAGHSITLHKPLRVREVDIGIEGVRAHSTNGTPADCVILARFHEETPPELVISGINAGANLGEEVFYSGTVAAAMEGCLQDLRSMAISVAAYEDCHFETAALFAKAFAPHYLSMDLPDGTFVNVNVPNVPPADVQGIEVTRLGRRGYENFIEKREDPRGQAYYWFGGEAKELDSTEGTDIAAVAAKRISITPVRYDVTAHEALDELASAVDGLEL